uniref:Uncharacterized protein n=1 Tax=Quercus lobata TaxID=97700 RepID=A0A7N2MY74_QUELO
MLPKRPPQYLLPGRPNEYKIAVCGYTSDSGGKNLQAEWYSIKVPNPDPHQYSDYLSLIGKMAIYPSIAKRKMGPFSSSKKKKKVKINPPSAKANEKGTIETEPLHPFSVDRMMHQSTQHAFVDFMDPLDYGRSLGGLDPVDSDSDGDGAHPFESGRYGKVGFLDAGWKALPHRTMTFPNRYNPQSVAIGNTLYVLGGFSRSQFSAEAAAKRVGWMESCNPYSGWKPLPNPPSGFSFNDDPLICTALDDEEKILVAQYNHVDMNCDSAKFYVYDVMIQRWTTLEPPVRKLFARYPDRTGRRSVAVGHTLYWGLFEDEDINVQAYDLKKDIWFHGSFNIRPVLGKDEFLADNVFPASPPLLHLANQRFCLFLLTSIYDEKNCEVSNLYLNCLILDVSPINDEGDNHQHDYYDHVCYKVHGDVNVDDKEDNANYHVHFHDHFWRLSISFVSIHKYPLVNPIQLLDAVVQ